MNGPNYFRSAELVDRRRSLLLLVDMQEKLLPLIPVAEKTTRNCRKLLEGAGLFEVPISATEQYKKGLGPTTEPLRSLLGNVPDKLRFSCAEVLEWPAAHGRDDGRTQVVICGIEAHVCVMQTALDLVSQGYQVFVVADAVASRGKLDWEIALRRLSDSGVTLITTESVLFEWCECSSDPQFKALSALVKQN
ncbi:MAG: hydrolase [Planctomycetales bacterium]